MQMPPALLQMLAQRGGGMLGGVQPIPSPGPSEDGFNAAPNAGTGQRPGVMPMQPQQGGGLMGLMQTLLGSGALRTPGANLQSESGQRSVGGGEKRSTNEPAAAPAGGPPNAGRQQMDPQMLMQMLPLLLQHLGGGLGSNLPFYTHNAPLGFGAPRPQGPTGASAPGLGSSLGFTPGATAGAAQPAQQPVGMPRTAPVSGMENPMGRNDMSPEGFFAGSQRGQDR